MILQIIILVITNNFILYLVGNIIITVFTNIYTSYVADKQYPILKSKNKLALDITTKKEISVNVKSIVIYKIGNLIVTGVDNIIISSFIGVLWVGIYSNYTLIINKVASLVGSILGSARASIGNLNAVESIEKRKQIMDMFLFIAFWLFGWATIALYLLMNPFVSMWFGNEYVISQSVLFFLLLDFYLLGVNIPASIFRSTMGLFKHGRNRPIMCAIANLIVSFILLRPFGILGVVLGTFTARFGINSWYEPRIVYKYGFSSSPGKYILKYLWYLMIVICMCFLLNFLLLPFAEYNITNFIIRFLIAAIIPNIMFILFFLRTKEFKFAINIAQNILSRITKK